MLDHLTITDRDHVVEFAPGLGTTTRLVLTNSPASYTAVERDLAAAHMTRQIMRPDDRLVQGDASRTGLPSGASDVVLGEAMLTMQTTAQKAAIVQEAHRVLTHRGRYGIHELALAPDDLPQSDKDDIQRALSQVIHVGARPLTVREWTELLEHSGFDVSATVAAPMHLLEPRRLLADEGVRRTVRIAANIIRRPAARRRVLAMRAVFNRYAPQMCAVAIVARKNGQRTA
jgi:hypothetical protein